MSFNNKSSRFCLRAHSPCKVRHVCPVIIKNKRTHTPMSKRATWPWMKHAGEQRTPRRRSLDTRPLSVIPPISGIACESPYCRLRVDATGCSEICVWLPLPNYALTDGNLAELARQLGNIGETTKTKSTKTKWTYPKSQTKWDTLYVLSILSERSGSVSS